MKTLPDSLLFGMDELGAGEFGTQLLNIFPVRDQVINIGNIAAGNKLLLSPVIRNAKADTLVCSVNQLPYHLGKIFITGRDVAVIGDG